MPDAKPTPGRRDARSDLWKVWGPVVILAVAAFAVAFAKLEPPAPRQLKLAAGDPAGAYHAFARAYARELAAEGYTLEVVATAGAVENLERLQAGEVDLALVQGGVAGDGEHPELEALGSVFLEPVWVFHRRELELSSLRDLAQRRVAVGAPGSGTRRLAMELLRDNGLDGESPDGEAVELLPLGSSDAADALAAGEVDAAFFVASASAPYVPRLLDDEGVALMAFRRYRAYHVRHPFLSHVVLGEGVLDLETNLPPRDVPLLAAAASLSARRDLHHALVPLLVEAMTAVHGGGGLFEEAGTFPSIRWTDVAMRAEAAHYIENGMPLLYRLLGHRTAAAVDRLKIFLLPFIPLLIVMFKAAPPIYRWRIRSKIYRWYDDLRAIDRVVLDGPAPEEAAKHLATVERLEKEVTEVSVPLSYMDEFYDLRVHIELIKNKLADICEDAENTSPARDGEVGDQA